MCWAVSCEQGYAAALARLCSRCLARGLLCCGPRISQASAPAAHIQEGRWHETEQLVTHSKHSVWARSHCVLLEASAGVEVASAVYPTLPSLCCRPSRSGPCSGEWSDISGFAFGCRRMKKYFLNLEVSFAKAIFRFICRLLFIFYFFLWSLNHREIDITRHTSNCWEHIHPGFFSVSWTFPSLKSISSVMMQNSEKINLTFLEQV